MPRGLLVLLLCGAAAGSGAAANATTTRLHGVVMRGPISPVCVAERPCDAPAKRFTLVFSRNGHVAARTKTDSHGRYQIALEPGQYAVRIGRDGQFKQPDPDSVRVRHAARSRTDFHLDTGIR